MKNIKIIYETNSRIAFNVEGLIPQGLSLTSANLRDADKCITEALIYKVHKEPALVAKTWRCPTCESLVSYGNPGNWKGFEDEVNRPFVSLRRSFNLLMPLLRMLPGGKYSLTAHDMLPINNNNEFFWALKRDYFFAGLYPSDRIIPTQSPNCLNMDRVDFYRGNTTARAICISSFLQNLVIDGHHKATAAALDGRKVPALLITPLTRRLVPQEKSKSVLRKAQRIVLENAGFHKLTAKQPYTPNEHDTRLAAKLRAAEEAIFGQVLLDSVKKYGNLTKWK